MSNSDCQHYIIYNSGLLHLYYYSYCTLADIAIALSMYNPSLLKQVLVIRIIELNNDLILNLSEECVVCVIM